MKLEIGSVDISTYSIPTQEADKSTFVASITGNKAGIVHVRFIIGNERSQIITITVKDNNSSASSSSGQSTGSSGSASSSSGKSNTGTNSKKSSGTSSGTSSKKSNTVLVDTNIFRDDFANEFDPGSETGGYNISNPVIKIIIPVVNQILAILQIIGAIVLVISLALAGFNGILGSGDGFSEDLGLNVGSSINEYGNSVTGVQNLTKGSLSKILRRAFIGTIILEFSATIVRIVFAICTNL